MQNKIIQFGEGGFLRGFVDWMLQCVNDECGTDYSVTVVQPIEKGLCGLLMSQGGVYNHVMRGIENGEEKIVTKEIKVIKNCINPYEDYEAFLSLAEDGDYRFIVSNTTEAGISYLPTDELDSFPHVSFPAKVTALLYRRFKKGLDGFVFLPCELIDRNGESLKSIVLKYADKWELEDEFIRWVEEKNLFCNTLVDRIVTGYPKDEDHPLKATDRMLDTSELFHLWVIEGYRGLFDEIPFNRAGLNVILCDSIEMYRTRKVRILNGAHTSMIPYALLEGVQTVGECIKNEKLSAFVKSCVYEEIIPTLDLPTEELTSYADSVFERFANPFIRHFCSSIALNSVSKFKVRVLPSILEYKSRFGAYPKNLILSFAKLIDFYRSDMANDSAQVIEFMRKSSLREILANVELWDMDLTFMYEEINTLVNEPDNVV